MGRFIFSWICWLFLAAYRRRIIQGVGLSFSPLASCLFGVSNMYDEVAPLRAKAHHRFPGLLVQMVREVVGEADLLPLPQSHPTHPLQ